MTENEKGRPENGNIGKRTKKTEINQLSVVKTASHG